MKTTMIFNKVTRRILSAVCLLAMSMPVVAQDSDSPNFVAEGAMFMVLSADGSYTAYCDEGSVMVVVNTKTQETIDYSDSDLMPWLGYQRSVSNDGVAVGSVRRGAKEVPCYFKGGEIFDLPVPTGVSSVAFCNGISPDSKYIVGQGLYGGAMDGSGSYPLLWTLQDDGSYNVEILPHSPYDPAGAPAQNVSANDITADGCTIVGHKTPYDPYSTYLLVWKKVNGEWTCDESMASYVWNLEACKNVPEFPGEGPQKPEMSDYLTDEEAAAYNEALLKYQTDWNRWLAGEIKNSEISPYPYIEDYLVENRAAYDAAYAAWKPVYSEYSALFRNWATAYYGAQNGNCFEMNQEHISPNGKYIVSTMSYPDVDGAAAKGQNYDGGTTYTYSCVSIDVNNNYELTKQPAKGSMATSVDDSGVVFFAVNDLMGNMHGYAVPRSGEVMKFNDYIRTINGETADWIEKNMLFSGSAVKFDSHGDPVVDKDGELVYVDIEDLLITGGAFPSADGSKFACLSIQNIDELRSNYVSYFIDTMTVIDGIDKTEASTGDAKAEYFSVDGRRLSQPQPGINIVKKGDKVVKVYKGL